MPHDIEMVARSYQAGLITYQPGDKFNPKSIGDEHVIHRMRAQRYFEPLTRQRYAEVMCRRPPNSIGRGFTVEELVGLGIIDAPQAKLRAYQPGPDAIEHMSYWIEPVKIGTFTKYVVRDHNGDQLRPTRFNSPRSAMEFISRYEAEHSTESRGTATEGAQPEA